jgi:hypothetical protein
VVVDPAIHSNPSPSNPPTTRPGTERPSGDASLYAFGADRRNQPKTTDLIPKRIRAFALLTVLIILTIGLLNILSAFASSWTNQISVTGVESLGLTGRATLSSWFTSFLLIASGLASLQIYALRQHRRDDYHGSYRLWLWMSMLLLLGSVNCVVDLTAIIGQLFQSLTKVSFASKPWLPLVIKLFVLGTLIARGAYEVRESRGAFALVMFVLIAYCAAAAMQLPATPEIMVNLPHEAIQGNCWLLGTTGIFLAELAYARFIYLQAHGLIKSRTATAKVKKTKTTGTKAKPAKRGTPEMSKSASSTPGSTTESEIKSESHPASAASQSSKRNKKSKRISIGTEQTERDEAESADILKMNKSELRRKRKQKSSQQQRRAA